MNTVYQDNLCIVELHVSFTSLPKFWVELFIMLTLGYHFFFLIKIYGQSIMHVSALFGEINDYLQFFLEIPFPLSNRLVLCDRWLSVC